MLERDIERHLKTEIEALGGKCLKFESPGFTGVPDRIILMPGGILVFAETKAPGRKERPRQRLVQEQLRKLGFKVFSSVDSSARVEDVVRWCRRSSRFREKSDIKTPVLDTDWEISGSDGI